MYCPCGAEPVGPACTIQPVQLRAGGVHARLKPLLSTTALSISTRTAEICEEADVHNVAVTHVRGNPLKLADLRAKLDMGEYRRAPPPDAARLRV